MELNIDDIMKILPHRYPFLLVDKVIDITEDSITAIKNVTINEPQFTGHYPGYPIMPGVLLIEGLAQAAGLMLLKDKKDDNATPLFLGIDKARFKKEVRPGDQITYNLKIIQKRSTIFKLEGTVTCDGKVCVEAEIMVGMK